MPELVRLRIALADEPGALARVAALVGTHGGNITGVDVHSDGSTAVDDLTVEFADADGPRTLRTALAASGAGTLLSLQAAHQRDPVVVALRTAGEIARATGHDVDAALAAGVAELCAAPVVWGTPSHGEGLHPAGRTAVATGGAVTVPATELPEGLGERLTGEAWLLAVPDPGGTVGGRVVYLARSGPPFTATEISRVEALMAIAAELGPLPG